ncbi:hypothetical protein [Stenomitos frigidus]|uniref:Uncharacterized protein n=1 Tax=Stenomitos frigidus ULC18 TaxID=2107698 RepID=A0A2T1E0B9_9CYAN|nr:hypothetical protein [Stenomitos frigidus]PSB26203.1 hypothetical protein C7B82_20505 [Stenomitos frigidus ULC18]
MSNLAVSEQNSALAVAVRAPQLLYAQAVAHLNGTWLIVPTLQPNGRYSFIALDPEGEDWGNTQQPRTFKTAENAIAVGKAYVSLILVEMQGEAA